MRTIKFGEEDALGACGRHIETSFTIIGNCLDTGLGSIARSCGK